MEETSRREKSQRDRVPFLLMLHINAKQRRESMKKRPTTGPRLSFIFPGSSAGKLPWFGRVVTLPVGEPLRQVKISENVVSVSMVKL